MMPETQETASRFCVGDNNQGEAPELPAWPLVIAERSCCQHGRKFGSSIQLYLRHSIG
jgi:hypothetical protein